MARFNTDIGYTQEIAGKLPGIYITPPNIGVTDVSGGMPLTSGYTDIVNVCLRNNPNNASGSYVWLGSDITPPYSFGGGFMLDVGDGRSFEFMDPTKLRVVSNVSGTRISFDLLEYSPV
jgi:hypothetical protein